MAIGNGRHPKRGSDRRLARSRGCVRQGNRPGASILPMYSQHPGLQRDPAPPPNFATGADITSRPFADCARYNLRRVCSPQNIGACPSSTYAPDKPKSTRGKEILKWLVNHPSVTQFAIDDEDDELNELPLFQLSKLFDADRIEPKCHLIVDCQFLPGPN
jgi:hypothetical protein